ncbi:MAG: AAA family ATPase [Gammaproteobacteria bacterium]|nr:AAA family ATPase [Gammaproteobacteria bacterium]
MKLVNVQVEHFRNILDSTEVKIQDDVTCLVGKNESGKTAFLEALRRLNAGQHTLGFNASQHYPAWLEKRHRKEGRNIENAKAVTASFSLQETDQKALASRLGEGVFKSAEVQVSRTYAGTWLYAYKADENLAVSNLIREVDLPQGIADNMNNCESFDLLKEEIEKLKGNGDEQTNVACEKLNQEIGNYFGSVDNFGKLVRGEIYKLLPKFFYFAEYSKLPGIVKIRELLETDDSEINDGQRTAKALLMQAGAEDDYLLASDYETRKRELENVANAITHEVMEYWTTNSNLQVEIDISATTVDSGEGRKAVLDKLHIRMRDNQHMLSLPFQERSSGFQWFFSFLAAFSEYEYSKKPVIILLDEPGVGLHARAQADFLRFIDERLAKNCQVIYTTHSPFMIQPGKLERARVVEDRGPDTGSVISDNVFTTDSDSLFPLQGALGYDLAQHLFIGPDNLVVEGPSDYIYLSVLSAHLIENGKEGLDERWTITPVGGADLVPTFVALLGRKNLNFSVFVDSRKEGHQKLQSLADQKFLAETRIITVGQILERQSGDIEDLFSPEDYLKMYNAAFNKSYQASDLTGNDPFVKRIARKENIGRFDHGRPAEILMRKRDEILPSLSEETLQNFEKLFSCINSTLPNRG